MTQGHTLKAMLIITEPNGREGSDCYTLKVPEDLVNQGIKFVAFRAKANTFLNLYIHQEGQLFTHLPGFVKLKLQPPSFDASIEHEIIKLLNYNGENCNSDINYDFHKCREEYIYQVSIT